jgi:hypothetical protein
MAVQLDSFLYNFVTSSSKNGLLPSSVYLFPTWHTNALITLVKTPNQIQSYWAADGTQQEKTLITHFGSQWVILANFCKWLVQELQRPDSSPASFVTHLIASGKLMTDETLFPLF